MLYEFYDKDLKDFVLLMVSLLLIYLWNPGSVGLSHPIAMRINSISSTEKQETGIRIKHILSDVLNDHGDFNGISRSDSLPDLGSQPSTGANSICAVYNEMYPSLKTL